MTYQVHDPGTGVVGRAFPTATDTDVDQALQAASASYPAWRTCGATQRADLLRRVAELHRLRKPVLADIITREMGKSEDDAGFEIDFCADIYTFYADHADALLGDEVIPVLSGSGEAVVRRSSQGVILGVMPWNYPYYQVARFAAPNLLLGNTVILKPAPQCPESASALEQLFLDAGLPAGTYGTVLASNGQIQAMIADPRLRGVSLTGSARAGAAVAEQAGRHLKKVVLELGGSDPFLLFSTPDLDATVSDAVAARMDNTGQACNAAKRFIVLADLYEAFLHRFTHQLLSLTETVAPLSSQAAAAALEHQVERAVAQGARAHASGHRVGARYPPTVLTGVTRDHDVFSEELFGPVAMVFSVDSEEEALSLANDSPFGLGSYLVTTDPEQARRVADQLDAGMVFINGVLADGAELPFGGTKQSGFGRELGRFGLDEFANLKLIRTVTSASAGDGHEEAGEA